MPTLLDSCNRKSPQWALEYARATSDDSKWNYRRPSQTKREQCAEWACLVKPQYELDNRLARVFLWCHLGPAGTHGLTGRRGVHYIWRERTASGANVKPSSEADSLRSEFADLAEQWRRDTQHLSHISKKVAHPAYLRIIGMGEAVVPLLLEALRDRPAYWFAALKSTANVDPVPVGANPSEAREAWLTWGTTKGLIK